MSSNNSLKRSLHGLNLISLNMNSLNLSTNQNSWNMTKLDKKLAFLFKDKPDICLIQDIRLGDSKNADVVQKKILNHQLGQYLAFFNSNSSSRGVGILIKRQLNFKILKEYRTKCENALILDILINDSKISLGSLYGPRQRDNPNFFNDIYNIIASIGNENFLLAGDLNTVTCSDKPMGNQNKNIDLYNVGHIPNPSHMKFLDKLISDQKIVDIYRCLKPEKKTFSYSPFSANPGILRNYKSRLDIALSNISVCDKVSMIDYEVTPEIFDHKSLNLRFGKFNPSPPSLDNGFLEAEGLFEIGISVAFDTVNDYASLKICSSKLTELRCLKNEIIGLAVYLRREKSDLLMKKLIKFKIENFKAVVTTLPQIDEILSNGLSIDPVLFFQTLINNMTNEIISAQLTLKASEAYLVNNLKKKISIEINENVKSELESELKKLEQKKIEIFCKKNKLWKLMNHEKPSKAFCLMAKSAKTADSVEQLKNHNLKVNNCATEFKSSEHRKIESLNHYRKIYENPPQKTADISSFLGQELFNSNKIIKLTEQDKEFLSNKISLSDINDAVNSVNSDSAAGHDGITYKFYKIFLSVTGSPLLNCFNFMIEKEKLLPPFNRVKMILIPKKGDLTNIKNWRSLSLCYSSYKIFSTAISRKLSKVLDKLTSVEQKAYSRSKNISETILNIFNRISRSNKKNEKLATLALDFSKAFDRLHHGYISEILEWLNFPESFVLLIKTILTNRVAYIKNFDDVTLLLNILVGVPQGDSISGSLFILCLQPLLIKLEEKKDFLNPKSEGIDKFFGPPNLESSLRTDPLESDVADFSFFSCYADDLTILFNITNENLKFIIDTMNSFESLSGLSTNFDKTAIMFSGSLPEKPIIDVINSAGIKIENSLLILGFKFNADLSNISENIDNAILKIKSLISFWNKMFLSTLGKVTISNTYLISQLSYLFAVITPSMQQCKIIDDLLKEFICGKIKISYDTVFLPKILGGLGMCKTEIIAKTLKLNLFVRSLASKDVWAKSIQDCCINKKQLIYDIYNNKVEHHSFSKAILTSFLDFQVEFYHKNDNIFSTPIRNLSILQDGTQIYHNFSTAVTVTLSNQPAGNAQPDLKLISLFKSPGNLQVKSIVEMRSILGQNLTHENYGMIKKFLLVTKSKFKIEQNVQIVSIIDVIKSKLKGSKKFKKYFFDNSKLESKGLKARKKLAKISTQNLDIKREKNFIKVQNHNHINNSLREFVMKLRANILYSNSQIAHFVQDKNAACIQCSLGFPFSPPPKESYSHMISECPILLELKNQVAVNNKALEFLLKPENSLLGSVNTNPVKRSAENLLLCAFTYAYYKYRNVNKLLTAEFLVREIIELICIDIEQIEIKTAFSLIKTSNFFQKNDEFY